MNEQIRPDILSSHRFQVCLCVCVRRVNIGWRNEKLEL